MNPYRSNFDGIAQDWEIGPVASSTFGTRFADTPDADIQRMYNDMITVGISQEVADGISVSLEWRRRSYKDSVSGDNLSRNFSDFGSSILVARPAPFLGSIEIFNIDADKRTSTLELDRTQGGQFVQGDLPGPRAERECPAAERWHGLRWLDHGRWPPGPSAARTTARTS